MYLGDSGVAALLKGDFPRLEVLDLLDNTLSDASVAAIAAARLPSLRKLRVGVEETGATYRGDGGNIISDNALNLLQCLPNVHLVTWDEAIDSRISQMYEWEAV